MPETFAAWIATNTLTAASVLTYSQIVVATYVALAAVSYSYGQHQRRKAQRSARDRLNSSFADRLVMTATAQAARSRVYGRVRNVDSILFKATHGANKEFYTLVIALAGHEVDAVETVYFNELPVVLDGSGFVQTLPYLMQRPESASAGLNVVGGSGSVVLPNTPAAGSVTMVIQIGESTYSFTPTITGNTVSASGAPVDGAWQVIYQTTISYPKARVRAFTGAASQNLYTVLEPLVGTQVQVTDRFAGVACLVVTLEFDQDAFPAGVPQISAVMRGARIFDPRSSVTAWTENPALIARDWSLHANGGGCVVSEINEPAFAAAANACDISTTFATSAGNETRPLYQCGTVAPLDANPDDVLSEICESMAGQWAWASGKLSVRAGVYRAPVATITEDWCTGVEDITIVSSSPTAEAINIMRPTMADAANHYVSAPAADVRAPAYITADGRELPSELQLGAVTRAVHAQHVSGVLMREARESLTLNLPCNLRAYQLEVFDVVAVTLPRFGFAAKLFEVAGWNFSLTGGVVLSLRETAAAIYTPDAIFSIYSISPNSNLPYPTQVPLLTGLAAVSGTVAQQDGSVLARTRISWAASTSQAVRQSGSVEVQYAEAGVALPTADWPSAPPASGRSESVDVFGLRIGVYYLLRGRFRNTLGMAGPWSPHLLHQVVGRRQRIIFRQVTAPTGAQSADGDEWFDTDDGNRYYVRAAGTWVAVPDGNKVTTFVQTTAPTASAVGDLWLDSDDGNKLYRWSGSAWVALPVGTGGIQANAVTKVYSGEVLAVAVTGTAGTGPQGYDTIKWSLIDTMAFTASFTGDALLNLSGVLSFSGTPSIETNYLWCEAWVNCDFNADNVVDAGEQLIYLFGKAFSTTAPQASFPFAYSGKKAVTSGVNYSWKLYGKRLEGTVTADRLTWRIEELKR